MSGLRHGKASDACNPVSLKKDMYTISKIGKMVSASVLKEFASCEVAKT